MPNLRRIGRDVEDRAAQFLLDKGYTIVTRRYQIRGGELDIVALDGDILVFVEVKFRQNDAVAPETAIDDTKVASMCAAAKRYCHETGSENRQTRFDVIAVTPSAIRHHIDAIRPR